MWNILKKRSRNIENESNISIPLKFVTMQPILVSLNRIYENPQSFHLYPNDTSNLKA
ncbi:hypothetical protein BDF21DRAFT_412917 [Thamnidium elegans]|nr:hypothetical protein BDF21DRAFT_412917 [Thamnidium elegans]